MIYIMVNLCRDNGMNRESAYNTWFNSKTRNYIINNNLYWVSGMRCYWELCLELGNSDDWLKEPFDI